MKQIRKGIFETNSSTTNCLIISRNRVNNEDIELFKKENGNKITFGKTPYSEIHNILWNEPSIDETTSFQIKADMLYYSMYVWTDNSNISDYLLNRKHLTEKLAELGFEVEYYEDPEILENYDYNKYDVDNNMWDEMWSDINEVIDYLFNDHVLYYSWCDECSQKCPKEIEEALHRFSEYENSSNEIMTIHHYR